MTGRVPGPAAHPPVEDASDAVLVERVRAGDAAAFDALAARHMRRAFSVAYRTDSDVWLERVTQQEKDHINRLCYGSFLLGHRPGYTSYKFGLLTGVRILGERAAEQSLEFGEPGGAMSALGSGLYLRDFEHGTVVVNLGPTNSSYTTPSSVVKMNGGVPGETFAAGASIEVAGLFQR